MLFRTGDIAEFMGVTNMGVLYLEKRGVITSTRDANGYRAFDLDAVTDLGLIRSFERLGFSLEEASSLMRAETDERRAALSRKKAEIVRTLEMLSFMEQGMDAETVGTGGVTEENSKIVDMPAMYYCPVWEDIYDMDALPADARRAMRDVDVSWLSAMPYMRYCSKMTFADGAWRHERGNCILVKHARDEGALVNDWVEYVPSRRCLRYYDERGDLVHALEDGAAYLARKGMVHEPVAFAPLLSLAREGGAFISHRACIYLPIHT